MLAGSWAFVDHVGGAMVVAQGGELVTGLLFIEEVAADMHALNQTVQVSLYEYPCEQLCPGGAALDELMRELE